jgi:RNA polymerase sigma factor (sigma-70 family)
VPVRKDDVTDPQAEFIEFYETNKNQCLRAVTVSVADRRLAEELVSEAFARAWSSWSKVRQHPAPTAWVVRVALNTGVSRWRRLRREVPLADHDARHGDIGAGLDRDLTIALLYLPARQRQVVALRLLLDLDTETTATVLGIAPGTVTAHLARATGTLRRLLVSARNHCTTEVAQC